METVLFIVIFYFGLLLVWFVVCLLTFLISIVLKRSGILSALTGVAMFVYTIILIVVFLYLLYITFTSGFIWFLLMIFIGIALFMNLSHILQLPFLAIPAYFQVKLEEMDLDETIQKGELLDEHGKVVKIIEGDVSVTRRLAKYYLGLFLVLLAGIIIFPIEREGLSWYGYIIRPFMQTVYGTFFIGIIYGIYRKIKYKSFFPEDKRLFFIGIWKFLFFINLLLLIVIFFLSIITGTYY